MEKERIINYWSERSHEFVDLRTEEQNSEMGRKWLSEIEKNLPKGRKLKILDVGTGTGFFALMLSARGHQVMGIDLTDHMIYHARELAKEQKSSAEFFVMDAEKPEFPDATFDVVVSRNLTWTLPHAEEAYREWTRVLKKGGVLLNFDADYGHDDFTRDEEKLPPEHAHCRLKEGLLQECEVIKDELEISRKLRPQWDLEVLGKMGYASVTVDETLSDRIYRNFDKFYNPTPMFALKAVKE